MSAKPGSPCVFRRKETLTPLSPVDLEVLQTLLGVKFKNSALLDQSLVHRSYLNENPDFPLPSNERLEFLGDAFLGLVIAEQLYLQFPALPEGELTKLRAALVRKETLADLSMSLRIGEYLYLGHGEEATGGRRRQTTLARALEAVIGAVFLDQGYDAAKNTILRIFGDVLKTVAAEELAPDYKSRLQELVQARRRATPIYRVVETHGPDHARQFTVEVSVSGVPIARGQDKSKQKAEKEAARRALEVLSQET